MDFLLPFLGCYIAPIVIAFAMGIAIGSRTLQIRSPIKINRKEESVGYAPRQTMQPPRR